MTCTVFVAVTSFAAKLVITVKQCLWYLPGIVTYNDTVRLKRMPEQTSHISEESWLCDLLWEEVNGLG